MSILTATVLSGCAASQTTAAPTSDPKATVTVWADATRQPGVEAFAKAHPDVKVDVELLPADYLTKLQLFNKAGSGWPDVIFAGTTNAIATLSAPNFNYAQPLNDLVPKNVQTDFGTSNGICTIDGKLMCLRNDIAPTVLWYNQTLMDQFGYSVPKTWQEYEDLGTKVAADHPGYVLGAVGDSFSYYNYFQSVGCPIQQVTAPNTVHIDLTNKKCTEMAKILDKMIANKSVLTSGVFDPATTVVAKDGKLLMMPGANWYGQFLFQSTSVFGYPSGQLAAAASPALGSAKNYSGSAGGGIWVVSKHAKNMKGAVSVAQWMTTDTTLQSAAPTYPGYAPAAKAWGTGLAKSDFFAADPFDVMTAQASLVNPVDDFATRFEPADVFTAEFVSALKAGQTIASALPAMQEHLINLAISTGYAIK